MTKNNSLRARRFCHWNICALVLVSDFVLRISSFWPKTGVFSQPLFKRRRR